MSVYFVFRTPYDEPSGKFVTTFANESVLEWFQENWEPIEDEDDAGNFTLGTLGVEPFAFYTLFMSIAEHNSRRPQDMESLERQLNKHLYVEGDIKVSEHCVQVLTRDTEFQQAYYFFDDHYLAESPEKARMLLCQDVELPTETNGDGFHPTEEVKLIEPPGNGAGSLYFSWLIPDDGDFLEGLTSYRLNGVRLPNLAQFLCWGTPQMNWPLELVILRACMIAEKANLEAALKRMGRMDTGHLDGLAGTKLMGETSDIVANLYQYEAKWRARGAVDPEASSFQITPHCISVSQFVFENHFDQKHYTQWYIFDDLWASEHPKLANAILRYGGRWDVLS